MEDYKAIKAIEPTALEIIEKIEAEDWSVYVREETPIDGGGDFPNIYLEVGKHSPAGEDFSISIDFDGTCVDLLEELTFAILDYDSDEHAKMMISVRGTNGVPNSIRELIDDADKIEEMQKDLLAAVTGDEKTYYIPVAYDCHGVIPFQAESKAALRKQLETRSFVASLELPEDAEYVEDSFDVDLDSFDEMNEGLE